MAIVRPFKGIRPMEEFANEVACLPYDVMNRTEAKEMAKDKERSFLRVVRSEVDLPDEVGAYDKEVYKRAKENLDNMLKMGVLMKDEEPKFYIYQQIMGDRVQTGLVACTSVDEYLENRIKKHELTRTEKEIDRINNFDYCNANTAPIFLTYRKHPEVNDIINTWMENNSPVYDFVSEDSIGHRAWVIDDGEKIKGLEALFSGIDNLYIADGHHRSASSVKVGLKRRETLSEFTGNEEFNYFLSVIFPDEDLHIMDYNRVVKDLNGHSGEELLEKISERFHIKEYMGGGCYHPEAQHVFGMFLDGKWYSLHAKEGIFDKEDPVDRLDVSILQNNLLNPILGIEDPRTDKRIAFIGGIRGLEEIEKRVSTDMAIGFSMYPTTMDDLLSIADAGAIMPPKSTWFEPKLRSGLFVHDLA